MLVNISEIKDRAAMIRRETIRLIGVAKSGHYTSVFSAAEILATLVRLYHREADYKGVWWGIRPENTGPYYDAVEWEQSPRIAAVLTQAVHEALPGLGEMQGDLPPVRPARHPVQHARGDQPVTQPARGGQHHPQLLGKASFAHQKASIRRWSHRTTVTCMTIETRSIAVNGLNAYLARPTEGSTAGMLLLQGCVRASITPLVRTQDWIGGTCDCTPADGRVSTTG